MPDLGFVFLSRFSLGLLGACISSDPGHLPVIDVAADGFSSARIPVLQIIFVRAAKTETKSGILCEIYGMSDRLATSPGGGGMGGGGRGAQLDTRRSVINDQVATSRIYVATCQMQFLNISATAASTPASGNTTYMEKTTKIQ